MDKVVFMNKDVVLEGRNELKESEILEKSKLYDFIGQDQKLN